VAVNRTLVWLVDDVESVRKSIAADRAGSV